MQNKIVHHPPKSDNQPESEKIMIELMQKKVNKLSNKEILKKCWKRIIEMASPPD